MRRQVHFVGALALASALVSSAAPAHAGPLDQLLTALGQGQVVNGPPCFSADRQIGEDPQGPPCIASWRDHGPGNGGVTAPGVTGDEIRVAYPSRDFYGAGTDAPAKARVLADLTQYFNTHMNLYGRKMTLVPFSQLSGLVNPAQGPNVATEVADAEMARELGVFASLPKNYEIPDWSYEDTLAADRIVSVTGNAVPYDEAHLQDKDPYQWSYMPPLATMERSLGSYVCQQLAGHPPTVGTAPARVFAELLTTYTDVVPSVDALDDRLAACGAPVSPARRAAGPYSGADPALLPAAVAQMAALKATGTTTVLCVCHAHEARLLFMPAATAADFHPEWVFISFLDNDMAVMPGTTSLSQKRYKDLMGTWDLQMDHAFGLSFRPKVRNPDDLPVVRAVRSVDPDFDWASLRPAQGPKFAAQAYNWFLFKPMLMLTSGFQMAGPNLTPESFARGDRWRDRRFTGLQGTKFPNPDTDDLAGRVGFQGDHSMVDDTTVQWWDTAQLSPWGEDNLASNPTVPNVFGPGTWCYVQNGVRHPFDDWGAPAPLFQPPCWPG
ncbi:MAG: hypothetical protein LC792_16440 [Actinobacteria bacterium]|nr:hypothetical protein [Actinomycetota bacterium]